MKRLVFNDITKELDFVEQGQEELFEGVKELDAEGDECANIFENSFSNVKGVAEQIKNIKGEE